jgi:hypothetical protein
MIVLGSRVKIEGDESSCGLYLVNVADGAAVKVTGNFMENRASRLSARLPTLAAGTYRVRVITQFSHGSTFLKEPRQVESGAGFNQEPGSIQIADLLMDLGASPLRGDRALRSNSSAPTPDACGISASIPCAFRIRNRFLRGKSRGFISVRILGTPGGFQPVP